VTIIGFDPGTKCGYAVKIGETITSGVFNLSPRRHEGGGMRFLRLRREISTMFNACPPDAVAYEEVRRHLGTDAAHIYGGIVAIISSECEARKIPYVGIPVGTVKKLATGKGNADKPAMMAAAAARWPDATMADDNEADARFVMLALESQLGAGL
jgi:crossover junction endodeoxyribonuclease RuvC